MIYYVGTQQMLVQDEQIQTASEIDAWMYLKDKTVIGIDIETTRKYNLYKNEGLDPWTSDIVMLQVGDLENQYVIDTRTIQLHYLLDILKNTSITFVGHNLKFEYKHLLRKYGVKLETMYDTMLVEQILYSGIPMKFGLAALSSRYLKEEEEMDKSTRLGFLEIGSRPFSIKEILYGAQDIIAPLKIKELQSKRIHKYDLSACIRLEMNFLPVLGDIEYTGMYFNSTKWLDLYADNKQILIEIRTELNDRVLAMYSGDTRFIEAQYDLFDGAVKCKINWGSSKQVIELFKDMGFCPMETSKTTGKLAYTVNAGVLRTIKDDLMNSDHRDFINIYLKYKETEQRCTTFGKDFLKYINPITKRVHSNYRQILNTGRISSSGPNLQNIPSDAEFRECFDCDKGYNIINADYSGQEQIILANKSLAPNLLAFYDNGESDMHSYVAEKIFPELSGLELSTIKKSYKGLRQVAKGAGFAINYGGNGHTIAKNLGITPEKGDEVYKGYFDAFPGLKKYFSKVQRQSLKDGYITIDKITKRKNFFFKPTNGKETGAVKRMAQNFPIQGEAGSITKLAAILFRRKYKWNTDVNITNLIHDEINIEATHAEAQVAAEELQESMETAAKYWCKRIEMKADAVIGTYWAH